MSIVDELLKSAYPAIIVERWTGVDGWPCFKVFLIPSRETDPIGDGGEYQHYVEAYAAAVAMANRMLPAECPIIDLTKGER